MTERNTGYSITDEWQATSPTNLTITSLIVPRLRSIPFPIESTRPVRAGTANIDEQAHAIEYDDLAAGIGSGDRPVPDPGHVRMAGVRHPSPAITGPGAVPEDQGPARPGAAGPDTAARRGIGRPRICDYG